MTTMTNKMFRRNFKNLPIEARILWIVSAIMAGAGVILVVLELAGMIEDHHLLELMLCNASLYTNLFIMNKYKSYVK